MLQQVNEFVNEKVDSPESRWFLFEMRRAGIANLVIENDGNVGSGGEVGDGKEIVMGQTGTAVQDDERRTGAILEVTKDLVERFERLPVVRKINSTLFRWLSCSHCGRSAGCGGSEKLG